MLLYLVFFSHTSNFSIMQCLIVTSYINFTSRNMHVRTHFEKSQKYRRKLLCYASRLCKSRLNPCNIYIYITGCRKLSVEKMKKVLKKNTKVLKSRCALARPIECADCNKCDTVGDCNTLKRRLLSNCVNLKCSKKYIKLLKMFKKLVKNSKSDKKVEKLL